MPTMTLTHILCALAFLILGYWLHSKYPGLLTKASAGTVAA